MSEDRGDDIRRLRAIAEQARASAEKRRERIREGMTPEELAAFDHWTDAKDRALQLSSRRSSVYYMLEKAAGRGDAEAENTLETELASLESAVADKGAEADALGWKLSEIRDRVFLSLVSGKARHLAERILKRRDRELANAKQRFDAFHTSTALMYESRLSVELARAKNRGDAERAKQLAEKLAEIESTRRNTSKMVFQLMERHALTARRYERFIEQMRKSH